MLRSICLGVCALAYLLAACDRKVSPPTALRESALVASVPPLPPIDPAPAGSSPAGSSPAGSPTGRQVRMTVSGHEVTLNLLPAVPDAIAAQMSPFIRDAGFACDEVIEANQLQQQDGQSMEMFKISCSGGLAYQATMIGEKSYIKPWTGEVFGR